MVKQKTVTGERKRKRKRKRGSSSVKPKRATGEEKVEEGKRKKEF